MPIPNRAATRPLRRPPRDFDQFKLPRTRQPARKWFRVHQSNFPAIFWSVNTAHRFSHARCSYPLLYLAMDIDTCLFERFGDKTYEDEKAVAQSIWNLHSVSEIQVPELHVCDLTKAKTLSAARVDLTALMHHELAIPQEWGLAIQRHPASFQGIKFKSRFN